MKQSFKDKMVIVKDAIAKQLQAEGTNPKGLEDKIAQIAWGYMLVVQCTWFRLTSEKKIARLIHKYESITKKAMKLLSKYHFEDLVYTYRTNYTNLYEVSKGEKREYHLSKKDYEEFINFVDNGKLSVLPHPKPRRATSKRAKAKAPAKKAQAKKAQKSSATNMVYTITSNGMTKKIAKPTVKPTTKVVKKWEKRIKDTFIETLWDCPKIFHDTPLKIVLKDNSKQELKFKSVIEDDETLWVVGKTKFLKVSIDVEDIKEIYSEVEKEIVEDNSKASTSKASTSKASKRKRKKRRGGWVEFDMSQKLDERTFIKIRLKSEKNVFARFLGIVDNDGHVAMWVNDHGEKRPINVKDVERVYTYKKA